MLELLPEHACMIPEKETVLQRQEDACCLLYWVLPSCFCDCFSCKHPLKRSTGLPCPLRVQIFAAPGGEIVIIMSENNGDED